MAGAEANVRLDEIGVNLEALFAVIHRRINLLELDPDSGTVRVNGDCLRVALQPLFVLLESFLKLARLKEVVSLRLESLSLLFLLG